MYVCICNAVTDKQVRREVREGCTTLRELSCRTGCATTCGKCARMAREILVDEMQRLTVEVEAEQESIGDASISFGHLAN